MKRIHALILVLALGITVVAGTFAALRITQLGSKATATTVSSAQIAKQNRALARAEAALRVELHQKPPAVAGLPAAPAAQTVIYHRPAPIVHIIHRAGGEHEGDAERSDGGGLDD